MRPRRPSKEAGFFSKGATRTSGSQHAEPAQSWRGRPRRPGRDSQRGKMHRRPGVSVSASEMSRREGTVMRNADGPRDWEAPEGKRERRA